MISVSSFRYLFRAFQKPHALLYNLLANSKSKCVFFHETKLLSDNFKIEIKMPSLSPTMTEGTIVKWLKNEGDAIEPGDVLCEIQTDKAVVGLETEEEGVLEKIIIPESTQNIKLGEIIAIITGEGQSDLSLYTNFNGNTNSEPSETAHEQSKVPKSAITGLMGPSVRRLLDEFNIKYADVSCSGPKYNLLKSDVMNFIKEHNLKMQKYKENAEQPKEKVVRLSAESYIDIPVSSKEVEKAHGLIQSKISMPHGYMSMDCKVDKVLSYIVNNFKGVSLNEFIVKSTAAALKKVPKISNVRRNGQLIQSGDSINISITDYNGGKSETYFIKDAGSLNVEGISEEMKERKSSDGAFQISNLSSLDISNFVEVISPNDVATLAVSGIQSVFEEGASVRKMRVTLSFDNYVVGETEAGEFLDTFKKCLENPLMC